MILELKSFRIPREGGALNSKIQCFLIYTNLNFRIFGILELVVTELIRGVV